MGVQLNIKSPRARALAERLAAITDTSLTDAVVDALSRRVRQVEHDQAISADEVREREADFYAMIVGSRERWKGAMLSLDHGDLLYDEDGLPR